MSQRSWYLSLHWTARFLAVLIAGFIFLFFFGEGAGLHGTLLPAHLSFRDGFLLFLVLGSSAAMLFAWIWERWAGAIDVLLGGAFLACCFFMHGMQRVWFLGVALLLPGLLYMTAATLRAPRHTSAQ